MKKTAQAPKTVVPDGIDRDALILALDIGTRSVVGMLGYKDGDDYVVLDVEQVFHQVNAMRDGQIEDIELVAQAVATVKNALEQRSGLKFKKAAIAAAGRALKTVNATYQRELDEEEEISRAMVESLEYSVVAAAQDKFASQKGKDNEEFFCVGYSIVSYKLDDYVYANLEGHRGKLAEVEAVAAFLPNHVVESLYAVTAKNQLEIDNLTLEPIAAINVIVPRDIRLLNIAIVDIGAGTSDIAISKNGSIVAYGMATIAGDEITEAIMKRYLAGFEASEQAKIDWANGKKEVKLEDIFGTVHSLKPADLKAATEEVVQQLSKTVSKDILKINGGEPMAAFLVGGGSQTPGLCEEVAAQLGIPKDRVAVGGRQPFKNVRMPAAKYVNPEYVTPVGIGVVSSLYRSCNFFAITVNGIKVMAINNGDIRVMDALLLAGIKPSRLIGFSSSPISYTINGAVCRERGNPPEPGVIILNGQEATIQTPIKAGDAIEVRPAVDGKTPGSRVIDILENDAHEEFVFDGVVIAVRNTAFVNGKKVKASYVVKDGDAVVTDAPKTIKELYENLDIKAPRNVNFLRNNEEATLTSPINPGDAIDTVEKPKKGAGRKGRPPKNVKPEKESDPFARNRVPPPAAAPSAVQIVRREEEVTTSVPQQTNKTLPGTAANVSSVCINGVWHKIGAGNGELIFVDMLNYVDINTEEPQGILRMRINGRDASYVDPVENGDTVEIFWEAQ